MKAPRSSLFLAALTAVVIGAAFLNARAWLQRFELESERNLAQLGTSDLARLRADNTRLLAGQPSAAELTRLRADHDALVRLRAELETLPHGEAKQ